MQYIAEQINNTWNPRKVTDFTNKTCDCRSYMNRHKLVLKGLTDKMPDFKS